MSLSDDEIKAARALADAATPGPWGVFQETPADAVRVNAPTTDRLAVLDEYTHRPDERDADAHFIAASRTLVPALLDEVERLQKLVAMHEAPRLVHVDWTNCRHNERVDPNTGECLDCGTVLP